MTSVEPNPPTGDAVQRSGAKSGTFPLISLAPWAVAAALSVFATWFATQNATLRSENASLRTERQLAEIGYKMAQSQLSQRSLLAEKMINDLGHRLRRSEDLARLKVSALAPAAGDSKEARVIAIWDPDQQAGLLAVERLPGNNDTEDYQIWVEDSAHPNPVNGGIFHVAADGHAAVGFKPVQPVANVTAFALSLGKKGGGAKAEGAMLMIGR